MSSGDFIHYRPPDHSFKFGEPSTNTDDCTDSLALDIFDPSMSTSEQQHSNGPLSYQAAVDPMPRSGRRPAPRPFQSLPIVSPSEQLGNSNESLERPLNFAPVGRGRPPGKYREKSARRGKGRAVAQGVIIPIPNALRDKSLAETRLKRVRLSGDGSQDETEENMLEGLQTDPNIVNSKVKKVRGEYSCDQCYNRKTKCNRRVDGKAPSSHFPCDYCVSIEAICSTHLAASKKPESHIISMEKDWKRHHFAGILNDGIEQENLTLRQNLGDVQEKIEAQNRLHEALLSQLETLKRHNLTLEKAYDQVTVLAEKLKMASDVGNKLSQSRDKESAFTMALSDVAIGDTDDGTQRSEVPFAPPVSSGISEDKVPSGISSRNKNDGHDSQASVEEKSVFTNNEFLNPKNPEHDSIRVSVVQSSEANRQDIFQGVRSYERRCNDIGISNQCLNAYFQNLHPLMPVLHREAFNGLYRLYGRKALADQAKYIIDASTREGRAVTLICSVLALGAISLSTVEDLQQEGRPPEGSDLSHFGLGLGFYVTSLRLLAYTHDTIETMLAYLFMGVFAVHTTDLKEGFRRLQQFQTQAIALNLSRYSEGRDPGVVYDPELWPEVSNLVMLEIAKRAWSLFKVYLNNICLDLGRRAPFYNLDVERPKPVDDTYFSVDASTIEEYGQAPNPVTFILTLQNLSSIVESYSNLAFMGSRDTRIAQFSKHNNLLEQLRQWEHSVPSFLRWEKQTTQSAPIWIKMQRTYLQSQHMCISMKLSWSIANLDPVTIPTYQRLWEDTYEPSLKAATTVLKIAKESAGVKLIPRTLYHAEAMRATTLILQIILRNVSLEPTQLDRFVVTCRDGITICRSLVPKILTRAEDTHENLLNEHLAGLHTKAPGSGLQNPLYDPSLFDNKYMNSLFENSMFEEPLFPSPPFNLGAEDFDFNML